MNHEREIMPTIRIDAMGEPCPQPVVKTTRALQDMREGDVLEVHVDNETAVENLLRLANNRNIPARSKKVAERHYLVAMQCTVPHEKEEETETAPAAGRGDLVVAVTGRTMGTGSDELGEMLLKGFFFALTQLEPLPKVILLYNGGAFMSAEGSPVLDDLKQLEARGVDILTCGTCLEFFALKDKLAVGSVTNMYSIVTTLAEAMTVISP